LLHPESAASPLHSPRNAGTVIPPSRTGTSTRPTHDGIAYPFKLKVDDGDEKIVRNPSMVTLDSDDANSTSSRKSAGVDEALDRLNGVDSKEKVKERPGVERFFTAAEAL
jgi:hypothetical protein